MRILWRGATAMAHKLLMIAAIIAGYSTVSSAERCVWSSFEQETIDDLCLLQPANISHVQCLCAANFSKDQYEQFSQSLCKDNVSMDQYEKLCLNVKGEDSISCEDGPRNIQITYRNGCHICKRNGKLSLTCAGESSEPEIKFTMKNGTSCRMGGPFRPTGFQVVCLLLPAMQRPGEHPKTEPTASSHLPTTSGPSTATSAATAEDVDSDGAGTAALAGGIIGGIIGGAVVMGLVVLIWWKLRKRKGNTSAGEMENASEMKGSQKDHIAPFPDVVETSVNLQPSSTNEYMDIQELSTARGKVGPQNSVVSGTYTYIKDDATGRSTPDYHVLQTTNSETYNHLREGPRQMIQTQNPYNKTGDTDRSAHNGVAEYFVLEETKEDDGSGPAPGGSSDTYNHLREDSDLDQTRNTYNRTGDINIPEKTENGDTDYFVLEENANKTSDPTLDGKTGSEPLNDAYDRLGDNTEIKPDETYTKLGSDAAGIE